MFRFLYYKGLIEMVDNPTFKILKEDIEKDYHDSKIEPHQYELLSSLILERERKQKYKILYI